MAHWLLRGRMAEHNEEGRARQERIKEEQHRPDQPSVGAGEAATSPIPAAIANAIFDATGARVREVPFAPERVRAALRA